VNLKQGIRALIVLVGLVVPMILWKKMEELVPSHKGQLVILVLWTGCVCLAVILVAYPSKLRDARNELIGANTAAEQRVYREVSRNVTLMRRLVHIYGVLFRQNASPNRFIEWHDALIPMNGGPEEVLRKAEAGIPLDYPQFAGLPLPADDATEWESVRCLLAGIRNHQFDRR
jgi:hypothetical protein